VFSFICYGVAGDAQRVQAAEENATETKGEEHGSASAFSTRTANYFHEVFKKQTGLTPTEWLSQG